MDIQEQERLLKEVIDQVMAANKSNHPGTPMAQLRDAIEAALTALPPLEFKEFDKALGDTHAAERLVRDAPEIIGWNADQIVEWVEALAKKL